MKSTGPSRRDDVSTKVRSMRQTEPGQSWLQDVPLVSWGSKKGMMGSKYWPHRGGCTTPFCGPVCSCCIVLDMSVCVLSVHKRKWNVIPHYFTFNLLQETWRKAHSSSIPEQLRSSVLIWSHQTQRADVNCKVPVVATSCSAQEGQPGIL